MNTPFLQSFLSQSLIYTALKEVLDPELGINIVDLGLIYDVQFDAHGRVQITMTLTTPGCPLHASFGEQIEQILWQTIPDMHSVTIQLVWQPPWTPDNISEEGRRLLGIY